MSALRNLRAEFTGVVTLLVLGAGLLALFLPSLSPVPFWVVWIVGFAVIVPLVGILSGEASDLEDFDPDPFGSRRDSNPTDTENEAETDDPLAELRRRYAEGEIDEVEFERRLERLLETEDEAVAAEHLERRRTERERNRDPETGRH